MKEGTLLHEDSKGNKGRIGPGDVQWMTAGKGVVHSEIPGSKTEFSVGFQLWINLPKELKFCEPAYQDLLGDAIPTYTEEGKKVKFIAGQIGEFKGPALARQPTEYYDFMLTDGASHTYTVKADWSCILFVYKGKLLIEQDGGKVEEFGMEQACAFELTLEDEDIILTADSEASFILFSGERIKEPMVQIGPFVMNTIEEIDVAKYDFQHAQNGFEGVDNWSSDNKKLMSE